MLTNKEKGDNYEIFVRDYIINTLNKPAYLWSDIPDEILINAGLINSNNDHRLKRKSNKINNIVDTGVDILQIDDNNYTLVQCKNGYNKGIKMHDLTGIYMWLFNHSTLLGSLYYTSKLSHHITENINPNNKRLEYIKLPFDNSSITEQIQNLNINTITEDKLITIKYNIELEKQLIIKHKIIPHDYQLEASIKIKNYLINNNKAILSLPCGTGKTYTSFLIAKEYKYVIIISPLKEFSKQNLNKFIEYGYNKNNTLLINSDGTRNSDMITDFIKKDKWLISCTYKSVDMLDFTYLRDDILIIIDEFHNLSKNNVSNIDDPFYKLLDSNNKILSMSATPRLYELENDNSDDNIIDIGEIVYLMNFKTAIDNNYICDYKIYLPSIHENNSELISDISSEINYNSIDNELKAKCIFLYKFLVEKGCKKCIIYCENTEKLNNMINNITELNKYYYLDIEMNSITAETKNKQRNEILNNFANNNTKIQLLFAIRILDECIDIPKCDSIYITYETSCKIRTIQRICRSLRIDKNNKFKIGNILLWCNDYSKILETLSGIKENDILFKDKISILTNNYKNNKLQNKDVITDKELLENYIIGIKEYKIITPNDKKDLLFEFCNEFKKTPISTETYKTINIGSWLKSQKERILNNTSDMYIILSENVYVKDNLDLYLINKNKNKDKEKLDPDQTKDLLFEFCNEFKKCASTTETYKTINIGSWLNYQKKKILNKTSDMYITLSENEYVKNSLDLYLINKNKSLDSDQTKDLLFEFCNEFKRYPIKTETYKTINIGSWLGTQKMKILNNTSDMYIILSENEYVKNSLDLYLINKDKSLDSDQTKDLLFEFCNEFKKCPSQREKYKTINIGSWLGTQKMKILNNTSDMYIILSENEYVKNSLDLYLINKDKEKLDPEQIKDLLFEFCNEFKKCPISTETYKTNNIGSWLNHQKKKILNKTSDMYITLSENEYVKNNLDLYLINKDKSLDPEQIKDLLFEFCNEFKKCPSQRETYKTNNIGSWLQNQKMKIINKTSEMYKILSENEYVKHNLDLYLINKDKNKDKEKLDSDQTKDLLFEFCNEFKKCPIQTETYKTINIGTWLNTQKKKILNKTSKMYIILSENEYVKHNLDLYLINKDKKRDI